jgi:hypothetical protein
LPVREDEAVKAPAPRALRHGGLTTAVVLAVLGVLAVVNVRTVHTSGQVLAGLTARAAATVTATTDGSASVSFTGGDGQRRTAEVAVDGVPTSPTTVAYDPADTTRAVLPESPPVESGDRATTHLAVLALLALVVLGVGLQRILTRARLHRSAPRLLRVRRVRQQHRLLSRSWIEVVGSTPAQRFPVYFDPALVTLASPAEVAVHGAGALRALRVDGRWVYPSGRVRSAEPKGRLIDNPSRPDTGSQERAVRSAPLRRQLQVDGVLLAPAPFVGIFWVLLDGGGAPVWLGATLVTAALALWAAAVQGSDPS